MNTQEHLKLVEQYSAANYHPLPIVLTRGEGAWVWDIDGNKYLDCLSSYSALNQGHRHPKIIEALRTQSEKMTLTSRAFHNDQMGVFLKKLCELCEMEMALPMNTGVEAVETVIKTARKWGYLHKKIPKDKAEIIVCNHNFHGRTTTVVGFSSEPQYREGFGPFAPGFKLIDYGNLEQLEKAITSNTAAFLVEPIQGEAGILIPPQGYLTEARKICQKNKVLFILDEIQTGLGRTGKLFCYQYEKNAKPDLLVLGKALGGGVYPVSAVVSSKEILGVFKPGDHGSTFGGNPLASAVGITSLDVLVDEKLPENSFETGEILLEELRKIKSHHVQETRGKGLMIGVEIKIASGPARPFCDQLMKLGLLAKETHGQVIRLSPPLNIQKKEIHFILEKMNAVLSK